MINRSQVSMINRRTVPTGLLLLFTGCQQAVSPAAIGQTVAADNSWSQAYESYQATWPQKFDIGQAADEEFIAQWDIDISPDGSGLPAGEGYAKQGAILYQAKCAACHGVHGNDGPYDKLVADTSKANTIGNYWPYATTIYDYVRRAMPYNAPGTLTNQEVYDVTAYLLYINKIIQEEDPINLTTLPAIKMPAHDRFVVDDRRGGKEIR